MSYTNDSKLIILKLGGSAITDKSRPLCPRTEVMKSLAREISKLIHKNFRFILIHGGGSFGHYVATSYGIDRGETPYRGYIETRIAMLRLNELLCRYFSDAGIPIVPIHPSCIMIASNGIPSAIFIKPINVALEAGYVPVLHGDVVLDISRSYSIISGDTLIDVLTDYIPTRLVIFGMDVDGIYDRDPSEVGAKLLTEISVSEIDNISGKVAYLDVTGGIITKLRVAKKLAAKGIEVVFLNIVKGGILTDFLSGKEVTATRVLINRKISP